MIIFFQMCAGDDEQQINYRQHNFFVKLRDFFSFTTCCDETLKKYSDENIEHFLRKPLKENLGIPEMK